MSPTDDQDNDAVPGKLPVTTVVWLPVGLHAIWKYETGRVFPFGVVIADSIAQTER